MKEFVEAVKDKLKNRVVIAIEIDTTFTEIEQYFDKLAEELKVEMQYLTDVFLWKRDDNMIEFNIVDKTITILKDDDVIFVFDGNVDEVNSKNRIDSLTVNNKNAIVNEGGLEFGDSAIEEWLRLVFGESIDNVR